MIKEKCREALAQIETGDKPKTGSLEFKGFP